MKKNLIYILSALFVFALTACGGAASTEPTDATDVAPEAPAAEEESSLMDDIAADDMDDADGMDDADDDMDDAGDDMDDAI